VSKPKAGRNSRTSASHFPTHAVRRADLTPRGAEQNPQPTLASEDAFEQVPGNAWTAFPFQTKINLWVPPKNIYSPSWSNAPVG